MILNGIASGFHTIQQAQDASIYSAPEAQSKNYDGITVSRANVVYRAMIKFLPEDVSKIKDAAIMLFVETEYHNSGLKLEVYKLLADWREREVSWLNRTGLLSR